jgi:hypothetical protein
MHIEEKYKLLALLKCVYENKKISKRNYQNLVSQINSGKCTKLPAKYFGDDYIKIFIQNDMEKIIAECIKEYQKLKPFFKD